MISIAFLIGLRSERLGANLKGIDRLVICKNRLGMSRVVGNGQPVFRCSKNGECTDPNHKSIDGVSKCDVSSCLVKRLGFTLPKEKIKSSSRCIVSVASGKHLEYLDLTRASRQRYAEKCQATLIEITDDKFPHWPMANKWRITSIEADRICYIDSDVFIKDEAPDIFQVTPEDKLSFINELPKILEHGATLYYRNELKKTGDLLGVNLTWSPNAGVMMIPSSLKHLYRPPETGFNPLWCFDQYWLAAVCESEGVKPHWMDDRFNWGWIYRNFWRGLRSAWFVHLNGTSDHCFRLKLLKRLREKNYSQILTPPEANQWEPIRPKQNRQADKPNPTVIKDHDYQGECNIRVATSLNPNRVRRHLTCIRTWRNMGLDVVAYQKKSEIELLSPLFPEIEFRESPVDVDGKVPIEILAKNADSEPTLIMNSDLEIYGDQKTFVKNWGSGDEVRIGYRWNYDDIFHCEQEEYGIDVIRITPDMVKYLEGSDLCVLGKPAWDWFVAPYLAFQGFKLERVNTPEFFHQNHETTWTDGESNSTRDKLASKYSLPAETQKTISLEGRVGGFACVDI